MGAGDEGISIGADEGARSDRDEPGVGGARGARDAGGAQCEQALGRALRKLRKTREQAKGERKSAPWKAALAAHLKQTTQASNRWLSEQLHMGSHVAVSQYVGALRRNQTAGTEWLERLTEKPKT